MAKATTDTERAEIAVREMGEMYKQGSLAMNEAMKYTNTMQIVSRIKHDLGLIKPTNDGTEICK